MCLWIAAFNEHSDFPVVIASNRDEFYGRPTAPARFWVDAPQVLAGQDQVAGGTWGGVTRSGRFAFLTNFRDPKESSQGKRSRGEVVKQFLVGATPPKLFLKNLNAQLESFPSFNLIVGDLSERYYFGTRQRKCILLSSGLYGLSNRDLDTPWPKVEKAKAACRKILFSNSLSVDPFLGALADETQAPWKELPKTGVPLDWEKALSSIFIRTKDYGTRSSTVFLLDKRGVATFVEVTHHPWGARSRREFRFKIDPGKLL